MRSNAELIKERLGIAEVVGSYIKLEKAGGSFRARCPFHNEKTPSFFVSPTRNSFYCFGCEAKGDIFSFVERYEGVDFRGALKILAEKAGIELTREDPKERDEREELFRVMEEAASYFKANLLAHPAPRAYIMGRGLSEASLETFRIGYALPEWRALTEHLGRKGFSDALIEKAGLAKRASEGGDRVYDRFRGRIMFPLMDTSGRVIAFSGRVFDIPQGKEEPAKYINSPETPLFSKSKVLYGFDKAKEAIRKWSFAILVEGQMDLVMSHQAGYRNAVALSGTALTDEHVDQLLRLSDRLVLALDTDKAGIAAAGRSATLALRRGLDVKVALLSQGKDPADLIQADPELWKEAVKNSVHIVDYYLKIVLDKEKDERKRRLAVSATVLPYVALIAKPMDRAHFTARVAQALHLPEDAVRQEVEALHTQPAALAPAVAKAEETLRSRGEVLLQSLCSILWWLEGQTEGKEKAEEELHTRLMALAPEIGALGEDENLKNKLVFQAELLYAQVADLPQVINDLLLRLERELLLQAISNLRFELTDRERAGSAEQAISLLEEKRKRLAELDARLHSES